MAFWGKHVMCKIHNCTPAAIRCPLHIKKFSEDLVKAINMKPYGNPLIEHFGSGDAVGITLVQLIETSNITAHFCEKSNSGYIDVFSCRDFDERDVEDELQKKFNPTSIDTQIIYR